MSEQELPPLDVTIGETKLARIVPSMIAQPYVAWLQCRERQLRASLAREAALTAQVEELTDRAKNAEAHELLAQSRAEKAEADLAALRALVNSPETDDFFKGIELEAAHQRVRWPSEQDAGKTHADWFWLVGYLTGKCLHAAMAGNRNKALHHTISTAAALANWHRAIKGVGNMRPGIAEPTERILDATGGIVNDSPIP